MTSSAYGVTIAPDRAEAIYQRGARIGFSVNVTRDGEAVTRGQVEYVLRKNLVEEIDRGTATLGVEPMVIDSRLDVPGLVDCAVTFRPADADPIAASVGAAVDPFDIRPSMPPPDDFDAFWDGKLAQLANVPLEPELTAQASWDDAIECFDTRVACLGDVPVSGYFARPRNAASRTLPAVLTVQGAGVHSGSRDVAIRCAQRDWLAMDINAHGIANGQPEAYYTELAEGELADYRIRGRESRETCYFVDMFLRVRRALDFLATQPEWNGRILATHGHSQGGFQSIAGAALDDRVTVFAAGVPAGCDHTGFVADRPNGWPQFACMAGGAAQEGSVETARYIDAVNFAGRTRAEGYFSVGFLDDACNPATVYAAYNNHRGPKRMIHCPDMGHDAPVRIDGEFTRWLMEHARSDGRGSDAANAASA